MDAAVVRVATPADVPGILDIYSHYCEHTAVSFEWHAPSLGELADRMGRILSGGHPYLVLGSRGAPGVLGFAHTGPFVGRAAYGWSAETTIYLRRDVRGRGLGSRLYQALEDVSRQRGILSLEACIGYAPKEDEHLSNDSFRFHGRRGYQLVGTFRNSGYKFGRWYDMVWMEKVLGPHDGHPADVVPFFELPADVLGRLGVER